MQVIDGLIGWLIALAKLRMVFLESMVCALPALLAWSFVLGADPRVESENRHLTVIVAAVLTSLILGARLIFTGRFRPSPWLYVRAAVLASGIALLQLAMAQPRVYVQFVLALVGVFVLATFLVADVRVFANTRPNRILDVLLVYGSMGCSLLAAGSFHARRVSLDVEFVNGVSVATLETRHFFGLLPADTLQLRAVEKCERSSIFDGGEGVRLLASGNGSLLVLGDPSRFSSIGYQVTSQLPDFLERGKGSFSAHESRLWVFWGYLGAAILFLLVGSLWDTLCRYHSLTPDGQADESIFSA